MTNLNYVLLEYALLVIKEFNNRNLKIKSFKNIYKYFKETCFNHTDFLTWGYIPNEFIDSYIDGELLFSLHHNNRYLLQCFYNLQEKFDRKQRDFSKEEYQRLENFIKERGLI